MGNCPCQEVEEGSCIGNRWAWTTSAILPSRRQHVLAADEAVDDPPPFLLLMTTSPQQRRDPEVRGEWCQCLSITFEPMVMAALWQVSEPHEHNPWIVGQAA